MSDTPFESSPSQANSALKGCIGRRRLLRAGLAVTPVILAVSGRSAMAATCQGLSGPTLASLQLPNGECRDSSHQVFVSPLGLSPGYWKPNPLGQTFQPPHAWCIAPFSRVTINKKTYSWSPSSYLTYKDIPSADPCWATGKKYNAIFTSSSVNRTFSRILLDNSGSLEWHFCAAYLNAVAMPGAYALTVKEVLAAAATGCMVPGGKVLTDGQMKAFLSQTWA